MKETFLEKSFHGKRKGQAEMFGLVIIVVLLIFALLFFVKIKQNDSSNVVLRSNFRANNLLNTIMDVNLESEGNPSLKELLKKCVNINDDSSGVCSAAKGNLTEIFGKTLLPSEKYYFAGSNSLNGPILFDVASSEGCDEGITASPVILPNNYVFQLKLCS